MLADEMGLGKTVQTIAAAEIFKRHFGVKSVLIICPTSLKYQWKKEIHKFTGRNALIIEGSPLKRRELYSEKEFYKIISYGACLNDTEIIYQLQLDLIIIDESGFITTHTFKRYPLFFASGLILFTDAMAVLGHSA